MKITKEDFDNAVKQPWNPRTCILAQAAIRNGKMHDDIAGFIGRLLCHDAADEAMATFDASFRKPGDENKLELQKLRASLPITI